MNGHVGFNDFQKINDYLYIGNQISAMQLSRLRQEGITHVLKVNGVTSLFSAKVLRIGLKVVAMEDNERYEITGDDLSNCFDFIKPTNRTVVVCTAGISRSATICIAYLMAHEGKSLEEAHAHVKAARRFIKPNPGFWRWLIAYEK